jgi:hypothetical protein
MEAFWCIVLSVIVLRWWWKHNKPDFWGEKEVEEKPEPTLNMEAAKEMQKEAEDRKILEEAQAKLDKEAKEKQKQYDRDVAELRKMGYTDELIAVIIPTINNDK